MYKRQAWYLTTTGSDEVKAGAWDFMKFMNTPNNHNFVDKNVQGWFWPTDLYDGRKATAWKKA